MVSKPNKDSVAQHRESNPEYVSREKKRQLARNKAIRRLIEMHKKDWVTIYEEELEKRGL